MLKRFFCVACATLIALSVLSGCSGKSDQEIIQEYIDIESSSLENLGGDYFETDVYADGSKLVISLKFTTDLGDYDKDEMSSQLESQYDAQSDTFDEGIQALKDAGVKSPIIEIIIKDNDGNEIYTRQFT